MLGMDVGREVEAERAREVRVGISTPREAAVAIAAETRVVVGVAFSKEASKPGGGSIYPSIAPIHSSSLLSTLLSSLSS